MEDAQLAPNSRHQGVPASRPKSLLDWAGRPGLLRSDLCLFGDLQRIIYLDAEVAHGRLLHIRHPTLTQPILVLFSDRSMAGAVSRALDRQ